MSDHSIRQRAIYLTYALKRDLFNKLVIDHLYKSGDLDYRRFCRCWKRFIRILLVQYGLFPAAVPITRINGALGIKANVLIYLMIGCGWLTVKGRKTRITGKGILLVEECFKLLERKYSTFWVEQEALEVASGVRRKRYKKRKKACILVGYTGLTRASVKTSY